MDRYFNAQRPAGTGEYLSLVAVVLVVAAVCMAFFWWSVEHGVPSLFAKDYAEEEAHGATETAAEATEDVTGDAAAAETVVEAAQTDVAEAAEESVEATAEATSEETVAAAAAEPAQPAAAGADAHHEKHSYFSMVIFLGIIVGAMASGFLILLALRRLKDAGKPPLLAALMLVPGVNLLAILLLAFLPGGRALTNP